MDILMDAVSTVDSHPAGSALLGGIGCEAVDARPDHSSGYDVIDRIIEDGRADERDARRGAVLGRAEQ
jgi:hypothetical protein